MDIYGLAEIGIVGALGLGAFRIYRDIRIAHYKNVVKPQLQPQKKDIASQLAKFGSAAEMLSSIGQGLEMQAQQIAAACEKNHVDPMKDVGYNTVVAQYQRLSKGLELYNSNPLFPIVDQILWPVAQRLPDVLLKRVMEYA